jgi:4-hydroxybenzoate polyprenyltransferase
MKIWLSALRVRQWNKQALIILPLIAIGDEVQILDLGQLLVIAIAFSLVASSIYIFNDLQDLDSDRLDTVKSKRPFAANLISKQKGEIVGIILLFAGFLIIFQPIGQNRPQVLTLFSIYLFSNLLYSRFNLKRIRIVGLTIVGLGFAIRFSIGTFVLDLEFSTWAFVLILQLSMFMLSGKRFQTILRTTTPPHLSPHTKESELRFWILSMIIFAAFFAATYSGFISDPEIVARWGKEALIISTLPLGLGLVRFLEMVINPEKFLETDATESMTKDYLLFFLITVFAVILFLGRLSV